jgi:hypothetical protein
MKNQSQWARFTLSRPVPSILTLYILRIKLLSLGRSWVYFKRLNVIVLLEFLTCEVLVLKRRSGSTVCGRDEKKGSDQAGDLEIDEKKVWM